VNPNKYEQELEYMDWTVLNTGFVEVQRKHKIRGIFVRMWLWLTLSWMPGWALLIVAISRDIGVFRARDSAVYIDRL
jgi:hypothetical protein